MKIENHMTERPIRIGRSISLSTPAWYQNCGTLQGFIVLSSWGMVEHPEKKTIKGRTGDNFIGLGEGKINSLIYNFIR